MYKTLYGSFNGDTWEEFCQLCFKLKHEKDGYQEMPAWQGDLGIEGFTRTGIVFQCYCPDMEYNPDKLYEVQREKITTDLGKLLQYEKELAGYLKNVKISKWIFVTPEYKKKDLVKHCHTKAEEFRSSNCPLLADDFDVLVHDVDFFIDEIPRVLEFRKKKVAINTAPTSSQEIADWKQQEITLVDSAIKKHGQRVPNVLPNRDERVNKLTQNSVTNFLNGDMMIRRWKENFQDQYEKFIEVVSVFEKRVEEQCLLNTGDNNQLYIQIEQDLKSRLRMSFDYLEEIMIERLTNYVMADWIMRCPISFE